MLEKVEREKEAALQEARQRAETLLREREEGYGAARTQEALRWRAEGEAASARATAESLREQAEASERICRSLCEEAEAASAVMEAELERARREAVTAEDKVRQGGGYVKELEFHKTVCIAARQLFHVLGPPIDAENFRWTTALSKNVLFLIDTSNVLLSTLIWHLEYCFVHIHGCHGTGSRGSQPWTRSAKSCRR